MTVGCDHLVREASADERPWSDGRPAAVRGAHVADARLAAALVAVALGYATLRYNLFKGVPWADWPAYTVNKALAVAALLMIAATTLRLARGRRVAILMGAAGVLALSHSLLSFALLAPVYYPRLFDAAGKLTSSAGLSLTLGAAIMALMELGARRSADWSPTLRHRATGAVALGGGVHAALPAVATWLEPATWPGGMPPLTLISFRRRHLGPSRLAAAHTLAFGNDKMFERRQILRGATALGLGGMFKGGVAWSRDNSPVRAILPSATHDTLAVKVLLDRPPAGPPVLTIDDRAVAARKMDVDGYSWGFVQHGLKGGRAHALTLKDEHGTALREPWTLRTLPPLDSEPESFRILFFTCAGGDEGGQPYGYLPLSIRRALFDRALSFSPDLAVANGDHVYWDLWTALKYRRDPARRAAAEAQYRKIAWIDEDSAFDSETNRRSLNTVIGRQIASIYEDRFASVPLVFVTDDHDYFENDNAGPWGYTLPPRPFTFGLQQRTADMAYPFALGRPDLGDPYRSGTVEAVRIGKLLELNLFDCRRGWSIGPEAGVLFPEAERFLIDRLRTSAARQLIQVPSNPFGWSAGKLGEWYPDNPADASTFQNDKGYWQQGWFDQHQRLAAALSGQKERAAVSISGDMHASAISSITRSGDLDLSKNPIQAILPGTIGTGTPGFPSGARGVPPFHSSVLDIRDIAKMEERNGFSIVDVRRDRIDVQQFRWRPPEPVEAIATLAPSDRYTIRRS